MISTGAQLQPYKTDKHGQLRLLATTTATPPHSICPFPELDEAGFERESIGVLNIPRKNGWNRLYKVDYLNPDSLKTIAVYYSLTDDGDVICDHYNVIESDSLSNFVQVDSYDKNSSEVSGKFSFKMLIKLPKCNLSAPDTLVFKNGSFHTVIR